LIEDNQRPLQTTVSFDEKEIKKSLLNTFTQFCKQLLYQFPIAKKLETQNESTQKLLKTLSYDKSWRQSYKII